MINYFCHISNSSIRLVTTTTETSTMEICVFRHEIQVCVNFLKENIGKKQIGKKSLKHKFVDNSIHDHEVIIRFQISERYNGKECSWT